jgi:peptidoglycan lytic transglycosylase D
LKLLRCSLLLTLTVGACARHAPRVAPTPVGKSANAAARDSSTAAVTTPAMPLDAELVDTATVSSDEVAEQAARVFGDSIAPGDTALVSDSAIVTWDIDVRSFEAHARVEHYVRLFSGDARGRMEQRLLRGMRYEPMIRAKFRAAGLPEDMYYLALIESGFDPHAYSSAAAVGMWQFMTSTAKGIGMRVDWWVDERRDPMRSTDGAIRFLGWLNEQFGSLYLAAAAYNGGPGRVSRGLTRFAEDLEGQTGDSRFFALAEKNYLPAQTRDYVPQLIAAAIVAKEPSRYGLSLPPQPAYAYDSVRVGPSTPLAAVAKATRVTVAEINDLNPHILRGVTPPHGTLNVRVPLGTSAGFDSSFRALPEADRVAYRPLVSKKGQTLGGIAARNGLTVKQLGWYNRRVQQSRKTGRLTAGQTILVPSGAVALAAFDVPDPAIERYSSSAKIHIVRKGEYLGGIAKRYGTSVGAIMRLNGMRKSVIFPGQALVVKGSPRRGRAATGRRSRTGKAVVAPARKKSHG